MTFPKWVEEFAKDIHCDECLCPNELHVRTVPILKALSVAVEALEKMAVGLRYDDKIPKEALAQIEKMGEK